MLSSISNVAQEPPVRKWEEDSIASAGRLQTQKKSTNLLMKISVIGEYLYRFYRSSQSDKITLLRQCGALVPRVAQFFL